MNNYRILNDLPGNPPQIPQMFNVPPVMVQYMRVLSGHLMNSLQNRAMAGNGDFQSGFWMTCANNSFNNQVYAEILKHAAAHAYGVLANANGQIGDANSWLAQSADFIAGNYTVYWCRTNAPQAFGNIDQMTLNKIVSDSAQYVTNISQLVGYFDNAAQQGQNNMMGFSGGFGNVGNAWGVGGGGNYNAAQAMATAMMGNNGGMNAWGVSTGGTGFNAGAFGNTLNNNSAYTNQNGGWGFGNNQQNDNILGAGKVAGFETSSATGNSNNNGAVDLAATWKVTSGAKNTADLGWGDGISSNNAQAGGTPSGFTPVSSMNAMLEHANEINVAARTAELQPISNQEIASSSYKLDTGTVSVMQTENHLQQGIKVVVNPANPKVRIPMVGGNTQRHLKFFNPETQYTLCTIENGYVVKQEIRSKEDSTVNFDEQNTARFIGPKGNEHSKHDEENGLDVSKTATIALHNAFLDTTLEQIRNETTAEMIEGDELAKSLARVTDSHCIRIDAPISASHTYPADNVRLAFRMRGVNAIFDKSVIVADIIETTISSINEKVVSLFRDINENEHTVSRLSFAFNKLRPFIGEDTWMGLNNRITTWLNVELYANYGVDISITDFAGDFIDLTDLMVSEAYGFTAEEMHKLVTNIITKFLVVYDSEHPLAEMLYTEMNGYDPEEERRLLGVMNRYVFLPIYSSKLVVSTNSESGIINVTNQPELYNIVASTLSNLTTNSQDGIARNYLVTLNGDMILVTRPDGMSQYILTRMVGDVVVNPLVGK